MKYLITVTTHDHETINLFANSEHQARFAARLIAAHDDVAKITIHQELKSGLKLIQEWGKL